MKPTFFKCSVSLSCSRFATTNFNDEKHPLQAVNAMRLAFLGEDALDDDVDGAEWIMIVQTMTVALVDDEDDIEERGGCRCRFGRSLSESV